mgnify:CR=1 FL=1
MTTTEAFPQAMPQAVPGPKPYPPAPPPGPAVLTIHTPDGPHIYTHADIEALGLLLSGVAVFVADRAARAAFERRENAERAVDQLVQESDLLSHLVQSFTTTGQTRYLSVYYDILAVRQGEKAAPAVDNPIIHWRQLAATGVDSPATHGAAAPLALLDRLRSLDFSADELAAVQAMLQATGPMQAVEKIAFAALTTIARISPLYLLSIKVRYLCPSSSSRLPYITFVPMRAMVVFFGSLNSTAMLARSLPDSFLGGAPLMAGVVAR